MTRTYPNPISEQAQNHRRSPSQPGGPNEGNYNASLKLVMKEAPAASFWNRRDYINSKERRHFRVSNLSSENSSIPFLLVPVRYREEKMTTSRRLADRKSEKFQKNITKRGSVPETTVKKGNDYPVGPIVLGFFVFVVIGSSLFQIIRTATSGGMA
ncbi:putative stress-associated endoplasmic reticulum protein [Canna indica]|uniref:Stress-associated endoplasmic reticulum protein n=1 Tax=Canna indica TaxID=4628 RepID=A0AAQ3PY62_9LILI|nr:putative stress-associated endoplasmic reticulum protein [Canna indica]